MEQSAIHEFCHNLKALPHTFTDAWFRLGKAPESEREESQATFHNFFLHIHSVRVHLRTLAPTLTFGLGLVAASSLVLLTITGVLLKQVFEPLASKTYGLMAVVKGRRPTVNRGPENTVMSWPHLMRAELAVFMVTVAGTLILAIYFDAPLKELANPAIPENPAKAPWYFLGIQELVSYSAFFGGLAIPVIVLLGLALIPFLDRRS